VNEEGTTAAAATAAVMTTRAMPAPPLLLTLDRPFLFFVENAASGAVLFAGVINSPGDGGGNATE
jgi:serpin B